ncbi:hypothetical protein Misp01_55680 [Microtetraspora sp. NBRC 13810]|uniref:hypothetical protein n=1 Tax=Microtetraspora sp. NBRC 13810 TaxID=3030990 RepID=UPI0024A4BB3B|nr:hypothetical protein [Microtetraspora sp. NBRC 13810]GLW10440.1 hypothetical protein Misp01_55680 [Microtetraspora sp. NBRC 13810]
MRFRTGLLAAGLVAGVMMGVGGTTAASASTADQAGGVPAAAVSWTGKPGCKFRADRKLLVSGKKTGVSEKRLKQAVVVFERGAAEGRDFGDPADVTWFARKLGVTPAEAAPILKQLIGGHARSCKRLPPADLDEGKWFAKKLGVKELQVDPVLDWATKPDGKIIKVDPKNPKCVEFAKKLRVSPKRLASGLEELKVLKETGQ